jgi:hypothetical protein
LWVVVRFGFPFIYSEFAHRMRISFFFLMERGVAWSTMICGGSDQLLYAGFLLGFDAHAGLRQLRAPQVALTRFPRVRSTAYPTFLDRLRDVTPNEFSPRAIGISCSKNRAIVKHCPGFLISDISLSRLGMRIAGKASSYTSISVPVGRAAPESDAHTETALVNYINFGPGRENSALAFLQKAARLAAPYQKNPSGAFSMKLAGLDDSDPLDGSPA